MNRAIDPLVHINFTKTISILALEPSGQRLQKISTVEMDVASVQLFPEGTPSKLSLVHIRLAFRTLIFLDMWPLKHGFLKGKKNRGLYGDVWINACQARILIPGAQNQTLHPCPGGGNPDMSSCRRCIAQNIIMRGVATTGPKQMTRN